MHKNDTAITQQFFVDLHTAGSASCTFHVLHRWTDYLSGCTIRHLASAIYLLFFKFKDISCTCKWTDYLSGCTIRHLASASYLLFFNDWAYFST
jgi:hypothetical protein